MKVRESVKEILLQPKYFGLLINKMNRPHTTIRRWIDTDYKDLRLPENQKILVEVTGLSEEEIFETETEKETA